MTKKFTLITAALVAAVFFYGCEKDNEEDSGQCPGKSKGPVAEFSFVISDTQPRTVIFTNTSADADSFSWNFGDNTTSSMLAPEHTYSSSGNFTVSLKASGNNGESDTQTKTVIINPF